MIEPNTEESVHSHLNVTLDPDIPQETPPAPVDLTEHDQKLDELRARLESQMRRMPDAVALLGGLLLRDVNFLDRLDHALAARREYKHRLEQRVDQETFLRSTVQLFTEQNENTALQGRKNSADHPTAPNAVTFYAQVSFPDHDESGAHVMRSRWVEIEDESVLPPSLINAFTDDEIEPNRSYYIAIVNPPESTQIEIRKEVEQEFSDNAKQTTSEPNGDSGAGAVGDDVEG